MYTIMCDVNMAMYAIIMLIVLGNLDGVRESDKI